MAWQFKVEEVNLATEGLTEAVEAINGRPDGRTWTAVWKVPGVPDPGFQELASLEAKRLRQSFSRSLGKPQEPQVGCICQLKSLPGPDPCELVRRVQALRRGGGGPGRCGTVKKRRRPRTFEEVEPG